MYVLISYDACEGRSERFRKTLVKYLTHELESVFAGDLTDSDLMKLKKELARFMIEGDSVILVEAANRNNVAVSQLRKDPGNGSLIADSYNHHKNNAKII